MIYRSILFLLSLPLVVATSVVAQPAELDPARWEEDISRFEKMDRESPRHEGGVLFLGSSSIRLWNLERFFPDIHAVNRGFGGSHIEDSLYYVDRIVLPYRPSTIVFYAGDNDINHGKSPKRVFDDYTALVETVHNQLPETRFVYIAIKPSPARWDKVNAMREANRLIAAFSEDHKRLVFVDIDTPMIGEDGSPIESLYDEDRLHLSEQGYELWSDLVRPWLEIDSLTSGETLPRVKIVAERNIFADMVEVRMLIDPPGTPVNYTLDGLDPTVLDTRYLAPFKLIRSATVRAWAWGNDEIVERAFIRMPPRSSIHPTDANPGLIYRYYEGDWNDWDEMRSADPKKIGSAPAPSLTMREREDGYGLRFDGLVHAPRRGLYTFHLHTDGAARLEIHGVRILEIDVTGGESDGLVSLDGGFHPFRLEFMRPRAALSSDTGNELILEYEGPVTERGPIPYQAWRYLP